MKTKYPEVSCLRRPIFHLLVSIVIAYTQLNLKPFYFSNLCRHLKSSLIGLFQLRRVIALLVRSLSFQAILIAIQVRPRFPALSRVSGSQHAQTGSCAAWPGGTLALPVTWWAANCEQPWSTCFVFSSGKARRLIDWAEILKTRRSDQPVFEFARMTKDTMSIGNFRAVTIFWQWILNLTSFQHARRHHPTYARFPICSRSFYLEAM